MTIKPCPFCGAKATSELGRTDDMIVHHRKGCFFSGGSHIFFRGEKKRIEKWNRRVERKGL